MLELQRNNCFFLYYLYQQKFQLLSPICFSTFQKILQKFRSIIYERCFSDGRSMIEQTCVHTNCIPMCMLLTSWKKYATLVSSAVCIVLLVCTDFLTSHQKNKNFVRQEQKRASKRKSTWKKRYSAAMSIMFCPVLLGPFFLKLVWSKTQFFLF